VSKHLSSQRACVTFSLGGSKVLGSFSLGNPITIYRPPFEFESIKIEFPMQNGGSGRTGGGGGVEKIVQPLVNAYPSMCN
jgi:hypothetical protein